MNARRVVSLALIAAGLTYAGWDAVSYTMDSFARQKRTTPAVVPNYRFSVSERNEADIERIKNSLEKVPDPIQARCNSYGGSVVIFDGKMTDVPGMEKFRGKPDPHFGVVDNLPAGYNEVTREVLLSQTQKPGIPEIELAELHEYGHLVDSAFGKLSSSDDFMRTLMQAGTKLGVGMPRELAKEYPAQVFAETFALFYHSNETRRQLKKSAPGMYEFFRQFEKRVFAGEI